LCKGSLKRNRKEKSKRDSEKQTGIPQRGTQRWKEEMREKLREDGHTEK